MKNKSILFTVSVFTILASFVTGLMGGGIGYFVIKNLEEEDSFASSDSKKVSVVNEDSAIINVAKDAKDSVVSIVITAEVPTYEYYGDNFFMQRRSTGTTEKQIGSGSGFIVSDDGLIVTNRHVVSDEKASYTVIFNDNSKIEAKVLARDTLLDIAFLKVEKNDLKALSLGSSKDLEVGQRVIAIGNSLGEFSNTVSAGIISGLQRKIVASDSIGNSSELLSNVIQTDASINFGNSGGPLLDIEGNVIGVNVAVAQNGENIAFSIPIDQVRDLMERLEKYGNIQRPILGVRYTIIDEDLVEAENLDFTYGALISEGEDAILENSPAEKAGLEAGDIILEIDGTKVDEDNPLQNLIQEKDIDDTVKLKVAKGGEKESIKNLTVTLFKIED